MEDRKMKKLGELLNERCVVLDFKAADKKEALERIIAPVAGAYDAAALLKALIEREALGSTGIGSGVAVPHVRLESVKEPVIVLGRSAKPVAFEAIDDEPCSLFFLVLGPAAKDAQEAYVGAMAKISRLMRQQAVRDRIMKAASPADVLAAIRSAEA